jgi:hypothetical protein
MALFERDPAKNIDNLELIESVAIKPKTRRTTARIRTIRPTGLIMVRPSEVNRNPHNALT